MLHRAPLLALAIGLAVAELGSAAPAAAQDKTSAPAAAACALDYQRADNMWADFGVPTANPGLESLALARGQAKTFVTDWKYEKYHNDGTTYYGSHLRVATNRGSVPVALTVKAAVQQSGMGFTVNNTRQVTLQPGQRAQFRDDLAQVVCP
jgi:hypothetical protein